MTITPYTVISMTITPYASYFITAKGTPYIKYACYFNEIAYSLVVQHFSMFYHYEWLGFLCVAIDLVKSS